ncbi:MAG TPA: alpha/beta hydrolase [Galbitalea sp.]|jgi:acetyl esterase/lipase|nr:alpha/beta hydrolase [Galbitalea sp.]
MSTTESERELARPPYDIELGAVLTAMAEMLPTSITPEMIVPARGQSFGPPIDEALVARGVDHEIRVIPGPVGEPDITVSIFSKRNRIAGGPGIYHIHGGGMILGDRMLGVEGLLDWIVDLDAVAVSVEYRLAPEHPDPAPVDDCYAGLVWMAEHADDLGFDANRLMVIGGSAGGGLSAGVVLKARDLCGPAIVGQVLECPMLDDRNQTVSSHQFVGTGTWDRNSNDTGWDAYLGDRRHTDSVSIYASPSRATDLSGLPPTYIDCGSAEVFRDEDVAYATAIWAAGGICELHVFAGGFHGWEGFAPQAALSAAARDSRDRWVRRLLSA